MSERDELLARLETSKRYLEAQVTNLSLDVHYDAVTKEHVATIEAAIKALSAPSATAAISAPVEAGPTDPMENWLMRGALEWLEQAEHMGEKERCKNIAVLLRTLWAGDKSNLVPCAPDMKREQDSPRDAREQSKEK